MYHVDKGSEPMAFIKIYKITKDYHKKIDAIMDEKKTGDSELIYKFTTTNEPIHQLESAYHIMQRFPVDEYVKPEVAHQIGIEFATQFLKDYSDYVVATHTHSKVLHNHIIFVSSSMKEDEMYRKLYEEKLHQLVVNISNDCCAKLVLSTIQYK